MCVTLPHKIITLHKVATLQASLPLVNYLIIPNSAEILSHVIQLYRFLPLKIWKTKQKPLGTTYTSMATIYILYQWSCCPVCTHYNAVT